MLKHNKDAWQLWNARRLIHATEQDDTHPMVLYQRVTAKDKKGEEYTEDREVTRIQPKQLFRIRRKTMFSIWSDFNKEGDVNMADRIIFDPHMEDIKELSDGT